jgi:hypothetical protein
VTLAQKGAEAPDFDYIVRIETGKILEKVA